MVLFNKNQPFLGIIKILSDILNLLIIKHRRYLKQRIYFLVDKKGKKIINKRFLSEINLLH